MCSGGGRFNAQCDLSVFAAGHPQQESGSRDWGKKKKKKKQPLGKDTGNGHSAEKNPT